jgi:beta-propeller repeat-containing protein/Big-like domain-containing protein
MFSPTKITFLVFLCFPMCATAQLENAGFVTASLTAHHLPLSFEENRGQVASEYDYVSRGPNYVLLLNRSSATLLSHSNSRPSISMIRIRFIGARRGVTPHPLKRLATHTNYLIGNDSRRWKTNVPNYARIVYEGLYDGVDLIYHGADGQLEFDFLLQPGANPESIRIAVEGAKSTLGDGLTLTSNGTKLIMKQPQVYQMKTGRKQLVMARYTLDERGQIGLLVHSYNRTEPLLIDPVLSYSTLAGGSNQEFAGGIAVDSSGNTYIAGYTFSKDLPTTVGALDRNCDPSPGCASFGDAFVAKLTPRGTRVWVTYLGGDLDDRAQGVAVDLSGNVYVTGQTESDDFPGLALDPAPNGSTPSFIFVTKINPAGTQILYSARFCWSCVVSAIAVSRGGAAFVGGFTVGKTLQGTAGAFQPSPPDCAAPDADVNPCPEALVEKLNAAGDAIVYATYLVGTLNSTISDIVVDSSGNAYVTGTTNATDFPTTTGSFMPTYGGGFYATFLTKFNSTGSSLVYSTFLTGSSPLAQSYGYGVGLDSSNNAYVVGAASGGFPVTSSAYQRVMKGTWDGFITKVNSAGSGLGFSTLLGGINNEIVTSVAVTPSGVAYVIGGTASSDFPTTMTGFQRVLRGASDYFVAKLTSSGNALSYSTYLGGSGTDADTTPFIFPFAKSRITLGPFENAYVTGTTNSKDFPTTPGAFLTTNAAGDHDVFAAQIAPSCALKAGNRTVTICKPADNATVTSPVTIMAGTTDSTPVKLIQVYVDGSKVYQAQLSAVMARLTLSKGVHRVTVQANDYVNPAFRSTVMVNIGP